MPSQVIVLLSEFKKIMEWFRNLGFTFYKKYSHKRHRQMDTWQNHQKIRWLLSFKGVNVIVRSNAMLVHVTKVFFKVSLWWPQGNFKRPLGGIWETVLHWYDLRSLYFERPFWSLKIP